MIIDFHAHIFNEINGKNASGITKSEKNGRITVANQLSQFMPETFSETAFRAKDLIEFMKLEQVDYALLLQNPTIGIVNDTILKAVNDYPEQLFGVIQVDPMDKKAIETVKILSQNKRFVAIKFELSEDWGWTGLYPQLDLLKGEMEQIIEIAVKEDLFIIIDTGAIDGKGYQIQQIETLATRYPDTRMIVEHLGYMTAEHLDDVEKNKTWYELLELGKLQNVYFGISAVGSLLSEPYPCCGFNRLLTIAKDTIGVEKLLFGTDVPTTLNRYTYKEMIDVIRCNENLTESEKQSILGKNAKRILKI